MELGGKEKNKDKEKDLDATSKSAGFARKVRATRAVALAALVAWAAHADKVDASLAQVWTWLRARWWFQHDSFEPVWATVCFATWLNWFTVVDKYLPSWKAYLMKPNQRKVDYHTGVPYTSGAVYLGLIMGYDMFFPRRQLPMQGPESAARVALGVIAGLFLYDLIFFPIHVAMHRIKALRPLHARHHSAAALYSTEVLRHSFVDGSLQVGTNIFVLNVLGLHPFTRMVYNAVITYMLTEIHAGFDCPWMLHRVLPVGLLAGPVRHEEHHATGRRFFQQFFCYLDDYFFPESSTPSSVERVLTRKGTLECTGCSRAAAAAAAASSAHKDAQRACS